MNVKNHTFLITGAGSGLGAATAEQLVSAGAHVVIAELNPESGAAHASSLGDHALFVETNVSDGESAQRAVDAAVTQFGGLNGLVNCAGIVLGQRTLSKRGAHDLESFARVIQVNLIGTFNMTRLAAAVMAGNTPDEEGERGIVINTSSVAAFDGQIGQVAYSASKGGVAGMTLPLARDLSSLGIRVMAIAPGVFETPMVAGMPEDVKASLGAQVPFPSRLGRPSEYAALAQHIIENVMLNGEVIRLDGAIRMSPR